MPSKMPLFFRKREVLPLAFGKLGQHDKIVLVFLQNLIPVDLSAASCILIYLQKHIDVQQTILQQVSLKAVMFLPAFIKCLPKGHTSHYHYIHLNFEQELQFKVAGK